MDAPAIRFSGVSKRFGEVRALSGVSLDVAAGSCVGLAGENGAGKTTLLKCLLDFVQPDEGAIEVDGCSSRQIAARARLAYLPERFSAPHYLTGREFVSMLVSLSGTAPSDVDVEGAASELDLPNGALDRPARTLSKGTNQKLGLAACFLSRQRLLVLDEPMSGLDPRARVRVKDMISGAVSGGRTVLFTSHALADIEEICDHMAVLHAGRLVFSGTPAGLRGQFGGETLERSYLRCVEGHGR
jgi:ABC-2 type transport system ATP-binding protein